MEVDGEVEEGGEVEVDGGVEAGGEVEVDSEGVVVVVVGNAPLPRRKSEPRNQSLPPQSRSPSVVARQPTVRSKSPVVEIQ
ncbi:hypothetical protein Pmani_004192 [Petrolisthes manimaculis]|uniref:Uncharacterized protein n=1 Tax=Petrolisthes manimaculis TaxID=1843537 RepID=A0AAE1UHR6_9EUCA|nr:hypothetical protein Pmani_004192 [Petrolisthes manimaculis]